MIKVLEVIVILFLFNNFIYGSETDQKQHFLDIKLSKSITSENDFALLESYEIRNIDKLYVPSFGNRVFISNIEQNLGLSIYSINKQNSTIRYSFNKNYSPIESQRIQKYLEKLSWVQSATIHLQL